MKKLFENLLGITAKNEEIAHLCKVIENMEKNHSERIVNMKTRHVDEIREVENRYEETINSQFKRITELDKKLKARDFDSQNEGKFYVFNPSADKPRKIYRNYNLALNDAKDVSKVSGKTVQVLKVLTSVTVEENIVDETGTVDIPF